MVEQLAVHFLPGLVAPSQLSQSTVVVIDVLRASTTIIAALAAGAREIVPCEQVDQARDRCTSLNLHDVRAVLGGERGGAKIEGFDLGNSPASYTREMVSGKTIVFTTTNGTRALWHAAEAETILVGAFVNLTAIVQRLQNCPRVHLLCAGTAGEVSVEDSLCAGAICEGLLAGNTPPVVLNDSARIARGFFQNHSTPAEIEQVLLSGSGGQNVQRLGLKQDIFDSARLDCSPIVPIFDPRETTVRTERPQNS